jgi:Gas vesicle protein G
VIVLDTLLIGGIKFVLRRIAEAVDAQLNDVDTLRQELLAAQMRVELGEMSDAEFAEIEGVLLARLREIQARAREDGGDAVRIAGVDVSVRDGVDDASRDAATER